jgi:thiol-disulfide isomerase/thioredoxin
MLGVLLGVRCYQARDLASGVLPMRELVTADGQHVALAGEGPTLVHVFATWCGVCRLEQSSVESVSRAARVIGIAVRSGTGAQTQAYMHQHGLHFPVVLDAEGRVARQLGVHAFPTSFFLNRQGEIVTREVGYTTQLGLRIRLWLAGW